MVYLVTLFVLPFLQCVFIGLFINFDITDFGSILVMSFSVEIMAFVVFIVVLLSLLCGLL